MLEDQERRSTPDRSMLRERREILSEQIRLCLIDCVKPDGKELLVKQDIGKTGIQTWINLFDGPIRQSHSSD